MAPLALPAFDTLWRARDVGLRRQRGWFGRVDESEPHAARDQQGLIEVRSNIVRLKEQPKRYLQTMGDLLWLSAETPDIRGGGGQRRQFHQISTLVTSGVQIVVATLAGHQDDSAIRQLVPIHRFRGRRFHRRNRNLERLIEEIAPTRAVVSHVESAPHVLAELEHAQVPFLIDFHNVVSRWHAALGDEHLATEWRQRERRILASATIATACSMEEGAELVKLGTDTPIVVAPHGIDPDEWPPTAPGSSRESMLAMFGSWGHQPNRMAAEWLGDNVWPKVHTAVPESRLVLMGPGDPPTSVACLGGVEVLGRVTSLAGSLARARIALVPIQDGIGTRVKFIESLASGAAVVSTTSGCEGFSADGAFLRADEPRLFADACIELLCDEKRAVDLGRRGRELAFARYQWSQVVEPIRLFAVGIPPLRPVPRQGRSID